MSALGLFLLSLLPLYSSDTHVLSSPHLSLDVIPADQPVYLGKPVTLTCQVQGLNPPLEYAVLFKRIDTVISEKCQAFLKNKYHLECADKDWQRVTTYTLHIKSVSWADRGDWYCIYAAHMASQRLNVYAPSMLKKMGVTSVNVPPPTGFKTVEKGVGNSGGSSNPSAAASPYSPGAADTSNSLVSSSSAAQSAPPPTHVGLGTRTNPYDLRPGLGLQFTCETGCGYPEVNISWLIANETSSKPMSTSLTTNHIRSDQCSRYASTRNMSTTKASLIVQCLKLGLVGLNEVQCVVTGRQYVDHTPTQFVYVLCPGGERPFELTKGEYVGIAVGAAIALILIFIACLVLRNSRKESPLPIALHFPGQRV